MLFNKNETIKEEYMADWPKHYFEIENINEREACLKKYLEEHKDSKDDIRRLELLQRRYGSKPSKERGDLFLRSYMMILISYKNSLNITSTPRKEKVLRKDLSGLGVLDLEYDELLKAEWENLADIYLQTCEGHSYRSTLFGFVTLKDDVVAAKIANEIDIVTRLAPREFHLEDECSKIREVFINTYKKRIKNGDRYWLDYINSPDLI